MATAFFGSMFFLSEKQGAFFDFDGDPSYAGGTLKGNWVRLR
eukprot:gene26323-25272_t